MLRNDGEYTIYIIEFKSKDKHREWYGAGDCGQFLPRMFADEHKKLRERIPFKSLTACGDCWQETGVSGTYNFEDALKVMSYIAQINPGREFRVAEVKISQKTTQKCCIKF